MGVKKEKYEEHEKVQKREEKVQIERDEETLST